MGHQQPPGQADPDRYEDPGERVLLGATPQGVGKLLRPVTDVMPEPVVELPEIIKQPLTSCRRLPQAGIVVISNRCGIVIVHAQAEQPDYLLVTGELLLAALPADSVDGNLTLIR